MKRLVITALAVLAPGVAAVDVRVLLRHSSVGLRSGGRFWLLPRVKDGSRCDIRQRTGIVSGVCGTFEMQRGRQGCDASPG